MTMASSFYRFARRATPPTVAAATATAAVAALVFPAEESEKCPLTTQDGSNGSIGFGRDGLHPRAFASNGIFTLGSYSFLQSYSPAFLSIRNSVAQCEAPPAQQQQPKAAYKPTDPAEPVADPKIEISSSDGKKVQEVSGMWGEESDGLVSEYYI